MGIPSRGVNLLDGHINSLSEGRQTDYQRLFNLENENVERERNRENICKELSRLEQDRMELKPLKSAPGNSRERDE